LAIPHKTVVGAGDDKPKFPQKPPIKDLAAGFRELDVTEGNRFLGTSFKNPEDFLPRIKELLLHDNVNARITGAGILRDVGWSNPEALGEVIGGLIPLLRHDVNPSLTGDPYHALARAVRDVAAHDVLLLPPPKVAIGALLFTWDRTGTFITRAGLTEAERAEVAEVEKAHHGLLADFMELLYPGSKGELNFERAGFSAFIGYRAGLAGVPGEDVPLLVGLGSDAFRKLFKSYYALRRVAHDPWGPDEKPIREAIEAVLDGTMNLLASEKLKRQALKRICELVEARPAILGERLHIILRGAITCSDANYLLICKIARAAINGGAIIPPKDAAYLLGGIGKRNEKAQTEGKALAGFIQSQK